MDKTVIGPAKFVLKKILLHICVLILAILLYKITFLFLLNNIINSFKCNTHKLSYNIFTNCFGNKFLLVHIMGSPLTSFFYLPVTTYHINNL